jgi:hypothetical protein
MQLEDRRAATPRRAVLRGMMASALAATGPLSPRTAFTQTSSIAPFTYHAPQSALDDLKQRLARTRWPEHETANDWSQGAPLAKLRTLVDYWRTGYDWRRCEKTLDRFPQYRTEIDGLGIHFLHVRSSHTNALPILITHGWPGSVIEFFKIIDPLTNPTAHGGRAEDAFHVIAPSFVAGLRILRQAVAARLERRTHRQGLGGTGSPARLHPLRRPRRRLGRCCHNETRSTTPGRIGGHSHQFSTGVSRPAPYNRAVRRRAARR